MGGGCIAFFDLHIWESLFGASPLFFRLLDMNEWSSCIGFGILWALRKRLLCIIVSTN